MFDIYLISLLNVLLLIAVGRLDLQDKEQLILSQASQHDIFITEEDGQQKCVQKYSPYEAREYLGVLQSTDGNDHHQYIDFLQKVRDWNGKMKSSNLIPYFNLQAMCTKIYKSLQYPLPALTLSYNQLHDVSRFLTSASLPKCNISSKFPMKWRFLPY